MEQASALGIRTATLSERYGGSDVALHGGYGYMREVGMEKLVRDAAAFLHSDGTNRALLKAAAFIRSGRHP